MIDHSMIEMSRQRPDDRGRRPRHGILAGLGVVGLVLITVMLVRAFDGEEALRPERVNERVGSMRGVRLGDSAARVRKLLGQPTDNAQGFFPEDSDFTGPPSITAPGRDRRTRVPPEPPETLHYEDAAYLVSPTAGVFSMATLAEGAETRAGVGVGDPLARVREKYTDVRCGEAVAGEPLFGGETPKYPWCRTKVGKVSVFFGEDPIESITLTRLGDSVDRDLEELRQASGPALYYAGKRFADLPLSAVHKSPGSITFGYGSCRIIGDEGGCALPMQIQILPFRRADWRLAVGCHGRPSLQSVPTAWHSGLVLFTERTVVKIYARNGEGARVARALRDLRSGRAVKGLPQPAAKVRGVLAEACPGAVPPRLRDVDLPRLARGPRRLAGGGGHAVIGRVTVPELITDSPIAFIGEASAIGPEEIISEAAEEAPSRMRGHRVRFTISEMLRGEPVDEIEVTNLVEPDVAFRVTVGERYLVFARHLELGRERVRRLVPVGYPQGVFEVRSESLATNERHGQQNLDQIRFLVRRGREAMRVLPPRRR